MLDDASRIGLGLGGGDGGPHACPTQGLKHGHDAGVDPVLKDAPATEVLPVEADAPQGQIRVAQKLREALLQGRTYHEAGCFPRDGPSDAREGVLDGVEDALGGIGEGSVEVEENGVEAGRHGRGSLQDREAKGSWLAGMPAGKDAGKEGQSARGTGLAGRTAQARGPRCPARHLRREAGPSYPQEGKPSTV